MVLECELKYMDIDLKETARRLGERGGEFIVRYFESNLVFDREGRELKNRGVLLRLRSKAGKAVLTVKRPPEDEQDSILKVFEEIETEVGDFDVMKTALETVGFSVAFAYEKVREKWRMGDCTICLDTLPFGDFVEIEGDETTVPECAARLGIPADRATKETYHALNLARRGKSGGDGDESFVFPESIRAALLGQLQKD